MGTTVDACTWEPREQQSQFVVGADVSGACFGHMVDKLFKEIDKQRQKMAGLRRYVTFLESMSGSYVLFSTVPTITCRISCV